MNKTVFNFSYETNPVEEVIIEPVKVLPSELMESFDSKIACFTNKVPVNEMSKGKEAQYFLAATRKVGDQEDSLSAIKTSGNAVNPKDVNALSKKIDKRNDRIGKVAKKLYAPKEESVVESSEPQDFTVHLQNIGGGSEHGKTSKFTSKARSVKTLTQNLDDFSSPSNGESRQIATHVTDSSGKVVWKNEKPVSESVEELSELSSKLLGRVATAHEKNYENAVNGNFKDLTGSAKRTNSQVKAISASVEGIKNAKDKAREAKAREDAKKAGVHESVKSDTDTVDSDLDDKAEFSKDSKGILKNKMPRITNIEPLKKVADSDNKETEKEASSDHGPNINQEPMQKIKGRCMESVTFTFKELIDIFSTELKESVLEDVWEIEVYEDNNIFKYSIKDGDDILAEGTNLNIKSATKSAYRKCLHLESLVISKATQPSRVLGLIKNLK